MTWSGHYATGDYPEGESLAMAKPEPTDFVESVSSSGRNSSDFNLDGRRIEVRRSEKRSVRYKEGTRTLIQMALFAIWKESES